MLSVTHSHILILLLKMIEEIYHSLQIFTYKLKGKYTYFSTNSFENLSTEISALQQYYPNQFINYSQILIDIFSKYIQISQPSLTLQVNTTISKSLLSNSQRYSEFAKTALKHILNNMIELSKVINRNQPQIYNFLYQVIDENNTDDNCYFGEQKLLLRFNKNIQILRQHIFNYNLFEIICSLSFKNQHAHACFLMTLIWFSSRAQFNQLKPVFTLIYKYLCSQNCLLVILSLFGLRNIINTHKDQYLNLQKNQLIIEQVMKIIIEKDDSNIIFLAIDFVLRCLDEFTDKQVMQKYFTQCNKKLMNIVDKVQKRLIIKVLQAFYIFSTVYELVSPQLSQQYFQIVLRLIKSKASQIVINSCYVGCKLLVHSSSNVGDMYLIPLTDSIWSLSQNIPVRNLLNFWRIICRSNLQNSQWKQFYMHLMKIQNFNNLERAHCFQFFKAIQSTIHYAKSDYSIFCDETISILVLSLKQNLRSKNLSRKSIEYIVLSFNALITYLEVAKQPIIQVSLLMAELFVCQLISENERATILSFFALAFRISMNPNDCLALWRKVDKIIKYLIQKKSNILISDSINEEYESETLIKFELYRLEKHGTIKMNNLQLIVENKEEAIRCLKYLLQKEKMPLELKGQILSLLHLQTYNIHSQNDISHILQMAAIVLSSFPIGSISNSEQSFYQSLFQSYISHRSIIIKGAMANFINQFIDKKVIKCLPRNTISIIKQYLAINQKDQDNKRRLLNQNCTAALGNLIYHSQNFALISDFLYEWLQKLPLKLDKEENKSQIKKLIELLNLQNFILQCFWKEHDHEKGLRNVLGLMKAVTNYSVEILNKKRYIEQICTNKDRRRSRRIMKDVKGWQSTLLCYNQDENLFNFILKQVQKIVDIKIMPPSYRSYILGRMTVEQINILKTYGIL